MTLDVVRLATTELPPLPAGPFLPWLTRMARALETDRPSDVPCGACTACCEGSYFIHVRPSDTGAVERIPAALLFPAPGAGAGHRLMGYDDRGRCPMLMSDRCTIYADRPQTCRTYDCRIFAATGLAEPGPEKAAIMTRAARWRFDYSNDTERMQHDALRAVCWSVVEAADTLRGELPGNATQLAMLLVRLHTLLLDPGFRMDDVGWADRFREAVDGA